MRRAFDSILLLAVIGAAGFLWYSHPQAVTGLIHVVESRIAPCRNPITYSIGTIDPRFGISKSILAADLADAEDIWEKTSDKNLFQYQSAGGTVTVNLVYDNRQAATDKLRSAGIQIDQSQASYDSLKAQYDRISARVESEQAQFRSAAAQYKSDEAAYNAEVQHWNSVGGAPPAEYAKLQGEKVALAQEFSNVNAQEAAVNADIDTVNALATTLNQLIVQLNLNVQQYNRSGSAGGEFEEGVYQLSGGVQTIDIYEYSDRVQLVRVLAHEMGHALGLEHVADRAAIMYKVNSGTALVATKADDAELNRVCSSGFIQ